MSDICSICLDNLNTETIILECNHQFHTQCIKKILSPKCPLCRNNIDYKKLFNINQKICGGESITHQGFGYSPYLENGPCRFCFGRPLQYYLNLKLRS